MQVYLLSVLLNALTGIILVFCKEEADKGVFSFSLNNETVRLVIGALSFITGILKILSPVAGNIPVIGDFYPALTGLAGGFILVIEYYSNKAPDSTAIAYMERIVSIINRHRKLLGFACLAAALIHFIFCPINFV